VEETAYTPEGFLLRKLKTPLMIFSAEGGFAQFQQEASIF